MIQDGIGRARELAPDRAWISGYTSSSDLIINPPSFLHLTINKAEQRPGQQHPRHRQQAQSLPRPRSDLPPSGVQGDGIRPMNTTKMMADESS